jgi:multiple sugar transport system permease protein
MRPRAATVRYLISALLGGTAVLFLTPFVWMVSTSLKPLEQTMSLPPTWIPRTYYATLEGERLAVTQDFPLRQAGVMARHSSGEQAGQLVFLSDGQLAGAAGRVTVLHRVEAGWWHVTERVAGAEPRRAPRWDIVPADKITSQVRFNWSNYPDALGLLGGGTSEAARASGQPQLGFWVFFANSLTVCLLGVLGTVLSNAVVAYGFARLHWRGRDAFFALTLATLMVPFPVLMVPLYGVFKQLGWIGTLLPLWVPCFFGSAFNIFLLRQFFQTIPEELSEAARIDGCSEWRIFWRIVLPLSKPVLIAAAVFHFLFAWNDFMGPLLYLTRKETFTLALALQSYESQVSGVQWHFLMAASAVTILPVVILFFFAQKYFIQGIATTGSKN